MRIPEPDHDESLRIVEGIAPTLAEHHAVTFGEDVLESAVALSRRYIVGRHLPDKAIVVLDSACARARMHNPPTAQEGEVGVGGEDVAAVVSDLTGVPVGGMLSDVSKLATRLEYVLAERVVGQDDALARCASQARAYLAGLSDRRRPVGALMFCGPSGVGKTETAHAMADALFGGRLLTINMSEYQEAHTVSGLKGAPAGYVGFGEGGVLTEGIRRTPYCVVLLDEIEKAHRDVIEMLYQVLDRGWMEDAEGIEADFSNALIILTTNVGDTEVEKAATADPPPFEDDFHQSLTRALGRHFPAAFHRAPAARAVLAARRRHPRDDRGHAPRPAGRRLSHFAPIDPGVRRGGTRLAGRTGQDHPAGRTLSRRHHRPFDSPVHRRIRAGTARRRGKRPAMRWSASRTTASW